MQSAQFGLSPGVIHQRVGRLDVPAGWDAVGVLAPQVGGTATQFEDARIGIVDIKVIYGKIWQIVSRQ